jgi:hypothetical protein
MSISATPAVIALSATSLISYVGAPEVAVQWTLTGPGTITPLSTRTDAAGHAAAKYTPAAVGVTVTVSILAGA